MQPGSRDVSKVALGDLIMKSQVSIEGLGWCMVTEVTPARVTVSARGASGTISHTLTGPQLRRRLKGVVWGTLKGG